MKKVISRPSLIGFLIFSLMGFLLFYSHQASAQTSTPCSPSGQGNRTDGLLTTPQVLNGSKFGSSINKCIVNNQAALPFSQLPSYVQLKVQYYDQSALPSNQKVETPNCPFQASYQTNPNMMILHDGSLTVDGSCSSASLNNQTEVVFIQGDLTINSNIVYHTSDAGGGLVFLVQGNIYINHSVTQIDAVLISGGSIYTASSAGAQCASNQITASPLVVNGSLISINPSSSASIFFCRNLLTNNAPAEQVNYQPKYLVILKDLISSSLNIESTQ